MDWALSSLVRADALAALPPPPAPAMVSWHIMSELSIRLIVDMQATAETIHRRRAGERAQDCKLAAGAHDEALVRKIDSAVDRPRALEEAVRQDPRFAEFYQQLLLQLQIAEVRSDGHLVSMVESS